MKVPWFSSVWTAISLIGLGVLVEPERAMAQRPIGIDISDYQSASINWSTLKNTYGISFAWAKISEGQGSSGGANFPTYAVNAKAAGVLIGAYHYARYDLNPGTAGATAEANYFWSVAKNYIKGGGYYIMPMLDIEAANTETVAALSQWINQWCLTVSNSAAAAGVRVKPCIYASSSHAAAWFDNSVTQWNLDMAAWPYNHSTTTVAQRAASAQTGAPATAPWSTWQFWQYDDQNIAQAYTTGDGDIFNGTMAQLTNTMVITTIGPNISSQPASLTVVPGTNATFSVTATGNGTIHYQWKFNGTNISAATASAYVITNVQLANAGAYSLLATDNIGSTLSDTAFLSVQAPLTNAPGSILAPTGLVDWWPGDGNPNDIFGNKNATPQNGVSYRTGEQGLAFHFDGTTSYLTTGTASIPVPWTASVWVNRQNAPGTAAALSGDGNYELKLEQYNGTHQAGFTIFGVADYNFGYTIPQNVWTHLAFVASGTQMQLYANGSLVGTITTNIPLPRAYIGAGYVNSNGKIVDYLLGSLDEILLFNRALSSPEINAIHSAGSAGLVRAPEFTGMLPLGNSQFRLSLKGQTGKSFTIYTSQDLFNWTSLNTVPNPTGSIQFTDNSATNAQTLYRARQP
jgi:GH25 family lysozyme M1 (1,4-beta-N-acetylmuramidase)